MNPTLQTVIREMATALHERIGARAAAPAQDTAVFIATREGIIAAIDNPLQLGTASAVTASMLTADGLSFEEGDSAVLNDPYLGTSHVQDFYVFSPVYADQQPLFYVGAKTHLPDIGGDVEGGFNLRAEEIWAEGVRISPVKLCRYGRVDTGIFNMILLNSRTPDGVRSALESLLAAVESGRKEIVGGGSKAVAELKTEAERAISVAETRLRDLTGSCRSGEYRGESAVGDETAHALPAPVSVKLSIADSQVELDLSMNGSQLKKPFNSTKGNTWTFALLPFVALLGDVGGLNGGVWRALTIKTRKNTLVDALLPAPTSFCTSYAGPAVARAIGAALDGALPENKRERLSSKLSLLVRWHATGDRT